MSDLSEERIQELVEEAERGYDPKTIKARHGGLGDVPELDYSGLTQTERTKAKGASIALRAYAHAARERIEALEAAAAEYVLATEARIEQLEGEVALLGGLVDEASVALITGNCPNIPLCERIAVAREERLSAAEQERQQP